MKIGKRLLAVLLAVTMAFSLFPAAIAADFPEVNTWESDMYTDVSAKDWFYENVKTAYEFGLMIGHDDSRFAPEGHITMAQTIAVAARLHSIAATGSESFEQGSPWYKVYADYALAQGIITAEPDDYNREATRLEFARILVKALPADDLAPINDVAYGDIPDVADDEAVYTLYRAGILRGNDDTLRFEPDSSIRRSEVAAIVTRMADPELRIEIAPSQPEQPEQPEQPGGGIVIKPVEPTPTPEPEGETASGDVTVDENGKSAEEVTLEGETIKATVPAGVAVEEGAEELTLSVAPMDETTGNITAGEDEEMVSYDVHIAGVAEDNEVAIIVELGAILPIGLNWGNVALYHVEDGATVAMTQVASLSELDAHNEFYYEPATGCVTVALASFSEIATVADTTKAWEGNLDYTWYDADATELTIANADQLAALSAIVGGMLEKTADSFAGQTIKLISDINLGDKESENNPDIIFYPIGYYNSEGTYKRTNTAITSGLRNFEGTFDGNGHTIANFYQNTWEMKGDHDWYSPEEQYYRDGMGLFGKVYGGTVKNLTVKNFSSDGEITTTGVIAAYADGATFENIAIFNCNPRVYNIGNGGIVGCVGWYAKEANLKTTFKNITVDNSNKISALWGSYDVACGGIVGQYYPTSGQSSANYPANGGVHFENCHISAIMDVYNDVCANYQYYAYRYTGMLIGSVRENVTIDGRVYPKMDGITASGCTVHFGTWNDYYYCEIIDNTTASYTHDYQMSRLTEIKAIDGTTITYLDGTTGTVPASGRANYVIVDYSKGHGTENATCYHFKDGAVWTHDMGGIQTGIDENGDGQDDLKEDKQHIYLEFNNLVTGYGWGVTSKGVDDMDGVTVLDRVEGNSVEKFEGKVTELANNKEYKLGDIFTFVNNGVELKPGSLIVAVTDMVENNPDPISATIVYDRENWEDGILKLTGTGKIEIIIQDYYFCTPTTITVDVKNADDMTMVDRFAVAFPSTEYVNRVGNVGTVALGKLFTAKDGIGNVTVTFETITGASVDKSEITATAADWAAQTVKFSNTGIIKVTISDDNFSTPVTQYLEVVNAVNVTTATSATSNNVVLLNNVGFSAIEVKNGYTLYGNGFTMTCSADYAATNREYGFVELNNGTLDNVKIVCPNFSHSILYESNAKEDNNPTDDDGRYYNIRSAVRATGNSEILNSYVSGGRAAVYAVDGTLLIDNSTIEGGAAANIHSGAACKLTLRDITLIQEPKQADVNDTSKTVMGFSVIVICDGNGLCSPITLEGTLTQYAWAHEGYSEYVPSSGQSLISVVMGKTNYIHSIAFADGDKDALNLGFAFMPSGDTAPKNPETNNMIIDNRTDKTTKPYGATDINGSAYVYSYLKSSGTADDVKTKPVYNASEQAPSMPTVVFSDSSDARVFTTEFDATTGEWVSTLTVDVDQGNYSFSFDNLLVQKYGQNLTYTVETGGTAVDKSVAIELNNTYNNEYVLTVTDDLIYDNNGQLVEGAYATHKVIFVIQATKTNLPEPQWVSQTLTGIPYIVVDTKNSDWSCAIPVMDGMKVKYWSTDQGKEVELDFSTITFGDVGEQNGTNNTITITGDDYTLTITTTGFKTNDNGKPVVVTVNGTNKLYFTVSSSANYVSTNTTSRSPAVTYKFKDSNGKEITYSTSMTVTYATYKANQYDYAEFCKGNLTAADDGCVTEGTLITMADGTQKPVEDLVIGDMILVFNHETGKLEAAPLIFNTHDSESADYYDVLNLQFSNGEEVEVVVEHGFFDMTLMQYVYIDYDNYTDFLGHEFYSLDGNVELVNAFVEEEYTRVFCPVTYFHMNSFANGMLDTPSIPGGITGLVNYFEYDPDLKWNEEAMQRDIEKYGLYTYADFADYISEAAYNSSPAVYLKVAVGKGMITYEQIIDVIEYLLAGSLID